jgi:hypothetical protein
MITAKISARTKGFIGGYSALALTLITAYLVGVITSPLLDNVCAFTLMAGYVLFQLTGYHP